MQSDSGFGQQPGTAQTPQGAMPAQPGADQYGGQGQLGMPAYPSPQLAPSQSQQPAMPGQNVQWPPAANDQTNGQFPAPGNFDVNGTPMPGVPNYNSGTPGQDAELRPTVPPAFPQDLPAAYDPSAAPLPLNNQPSNGLAFPQTHMQQPGAQPMQQPGAQPMQPETLAMNNPGLVPDQPVSTSNDGQPSFVQARPELATPSGPAAGVSAVEPPAGAERAMAPMLSPDEQSAAPPAKAPTASQSEHNGPPPLGSPSTGSGIAVPPLGSTAPPLGGSAPALGSAPPLGSAPALGAAPPLGQPPLGAPPLGQPPLGSPQTSQSDTPQPPVTGSGDALLRPASSRSTAAPSADGPPPVTRPGSLSGNSIKGASSVQLQGKRLRIGDVLIEMGMIDQGQLEHALRLQRETGLRLGKVLINEGVVTSVDIARALARRLNVDYVDLSEVSIDESVLSQVPLQTCTRYSLVPIGEKDNSLIVAMADPTNVFALDDIRLVTGKDVRVVVAAPDKIDLVVSRLFSIDDSVSSAVNAADDWEEDRVTLEDIKDTNEADAPAIRLVNQIITQAVVTGSSDLHFEPTAEDMVVRFRRDGVLKHITTIPNKLRAGVTSRLKIMAAMDISERRRPQDGRVGLLVGERPIDLRVAVLPTVYGEKVVLRVLDRSNVVLTMEQLGFLPNQLGKLRSVYTQPYGCLLVTGPTGSGKSTTLYAALNEVNDVEKNIITVEDPVEYRLKGIGQVQVHVKAGLTFASALRSILRCDPDIVMIGEMRDQETASIGIEAALTGHLVLSTLHTNTAPGAITRLTEMGIEPFLVSSSILGVLAQRLARRLCKCAEPFEATRDHMREEGFPEDIIERSELPTLYKPVGCHRCEGSGYKGRMGLHEVMLMTEEIAALTLQRASAEEIERVAIANGMTTLYRDGLEKVLMGQTTIKELQRIIQH